ncbi:MAG: hypothetical protein JKY53_05430 [Flavobacteriales bacterium]|nr:hypothetical protein [Flavobacteriales bacterium]
MEVIDPKDYSFYAQLALKKGLINGDDTSIIFYDYSILQNRLSIVNKLFPDNSFHSVAVKSNPLIKILTFIQSQNFGIEAASFGEILITQKSGIDSSKIVFDSPAKTQNEIDEIAKSFPEMHINVDSLQELERYKDDTHLTLSLRINPETKSDSVASMSVGGSKSKFGELISNRKQIIEAFETNKNLIGLHVHAGSQFHNINPTITAIRKVIDLANEINALTSDQIITIDIGGGFPVNYNGKPFELSKYVDALKTHCTELFDDTYKVITEFGRYYHANAGWILTDVEYVKEDSGNVIVQCGADMFVRETYNPKDWYHDIFVLNRNLEMKNSATKAQNIGGPLCFGGDYISKNRELPSMEQGDKLVIADCGANTFSLWSKHCSRQFPKVITYSSKIKGEDIRIAKHRESYEDLIKFWN